MAEITWSEAADEHLQKIISGIAEDAPLNAERVNARILKAIRRLERFPLVGRQVPEFRLQHVREVVVRPFRIIYQVKEDGCLIVAIIHGRRDLTRLLSAEDFPEF